MEPIPPPNVLDPNRVSRDDREDMTREDHRTQGQLLAKALDQSCGYARHLWDDLAAMRQYLHDSLPPEPGPDRSPATGASPSGPGDEQGWQRWIDAFAEVTSVLCGPRGDSGYGRSSAVVLAQSRRVGDVGVSPREPVGRSVDVGIYADHHLADDAPAAADSVPAEPATGEVRSTLPQYVAAVMYGSLGALLAVLGRRLRTSS